MQRFVRVRRTYVHPPATCHELYHLRDTFAIKRPNIFGICPSIPQKLHKKRTQTTFVARILFDVANRIRLFLQNVHSFSYFTVILIFFTIGSLCRFTALIVMIAVPFFTAVSFPVFETLTIFLLELLYVILLVEPAGRSFTESFLVFPFFSL